MEAGRGAEGMQRQKEDQGKGRADPGRETGRETARDSRMQRERQGEMPREGEIGSERTEVGGVGGMETRWGEGGDREREEGAGCGGPRETERHGHRQEQEKITEAWLPEEAGAQDRGGPGRPPRRLLP